ncbi:MAG: hypothetical protein AAFW87_08420 [Pseudomonadota bacterium]
MKKFASLLAAGAIAASAAAPVVAQDVQTSDPFVSTQGQAAVLPLTAVGGIAVATVVVAVVVGLTDSSSSSTTTTN